MASKAIPMGAKIKRPSARSVPQCKTKRQAPHHKNNRRSPTPRDPQPSSKEPQWTRPTRPSQFCTRRVSGHQPVRIIRRVASHHCRTQKTQDNQRRCQSVPCRAFQSLLHVAVQQWIASACLICHCCTSPFVLIADKDSRGWLPTRVSFPLLGPP